MSRGRNTELPIDNVRVAAAARLLREARSALFITGPGLSAESGLPHYRGIPGLTRKNPGDGKLLEAALSVDTLQRQPELTWRYLLEIDRRVSAVTPNRGHQILALLERGLARTTILTVNIDRLHQRAGSHNVIEIHGALHDLLCPRCEISTHHEQYGELPIPPLCATCGAVLRPDMPLFGEPLPADAFTRLQAEIELGFDVVFAIGAAAMPPYLARPLLLAKQDGRGTVEIGEKATDISEIVDIRLRGSPMRFLEQIWQEIAASAGAEPPR